jgi:DNA-binding response OmpR family regulator
VSALELIVAEDDPTMRQWLSIVLDRMGARVRCAASGWELLSLLSDHSHGVDLVISDVRMPLPSGLEALALARTAGVTTPFMLITAFADDELRQTAQSLGAWVLDKPFFAADLAAHIHHVLSGEG